MASITDYTKGDLSPYTDNEGIINYSAVAEYIKADILSKYTDVEQKGKAQEYYRYYQRIYKSDTTTSGKIKSTGSIIAVYGKIISDDLSIAITTSNANTASASDTYFDSNFALVNGEKNKITKTVKLYRYAHVLVGSDWRIYENDFVEMDLNRGDAINNYYYHRFTSNPLFTDIGNSFRVYKNTTSATGYTSVKCGYTPTSTTNGNKLYFSALPESNYTIQYINYLYDFLDSYNMIDDSIHKRGTPIDNEDTTVVYTLPYYWELSPLPVINPYADASEIMDDIKNNEPWNTTFDYIDLSTIWTLYIDGENYPYYKLLWECSEIEKNSDRIGDTKVNVKIGDNSNILNISYPFNELFNYEESFFKFNFSEIYKKINGTALESIASIRMVLCLYYGKVTSAPIGITLYSTKKVSSGLYDYIQFVDDGVTDDSVINVILGDDGADDDGYKDRADIDDTDENTDKLDSGIGTLTTTFLMTRDRLRQLGHFLWENDILTNLALINNNPIENIISCKMLPYLKNGTTQTITLGNVNTGVNGEKVSENFDTIIIGSVKINEEYNNFLDYNCTNVIIFLPYIGFCELDTFAVMGKKLEVRYTIDIITGGAIAELYVNNVRLYQYNCSLGVDIPITSSNRAQVEVGFLNSAVGAVSSGISGNLLGATTGALNAVTGASNPNHYSSSGLPSTACINSVNRTCYIIIDRPTYEVANTYGHTIGYKCNKTKTIKNLSGFTVTDSNIDLTGINCTDTEKQMIKQLLSTGIYV
jgi:hypothetical protein